MFSDSCRLSFLLIQATKLRDVARRCLVVQGDELRQKILIVDHVSKIKTSGMVVRGETIKREKQFFG